MSIQIVLDKSYLQAASWETLADLNAQHGLLMPQFLLYELVKAEPGDRAKWFARLPRTGTPYKYIGSISHLLRWELVESRPSGKPSNFSAPRNYGNHFVFQNRNYSLGPDQRHAVNMLRKDIRLDTRILIRMAIGAKERHPEAFSGPSPIRGIARAEIERSISEDEEYVRATYRQIASKIRRLGRSCPPADNIDTRWTSYRWLQVFMLFALDIGSRYHCSSNARIPRGTYVKLMHDVIDAQYLILGLAEGGLATKEEKLKRWWRLLLPNGVLYG